MRTLEPDEPQIWNRPRKCGSSGSSVRIVNRFVSPWRTGSSFKAESHRGRDGSLVGPLPGGAGPGVAFKTASEREKALENTVIPLPEENGLVL